MKYAATGSKYAVWGLWAPLLVLSCSGRGDINLAKATPLGVEPTTDTGKAAPLTPAKLFTFQPGEQVSFKVLADGTEDGGSPIIDDFDGDGMDNVDEITTNVWAAEVPRISTRVVTPVTMEVEALSYQTGLTALNTYSVSGSDLTGESSTSSERFYKQTLSAQAAQYEKVQYPSGVPSGQVSDFISPGLGFFSLAAQSSGFNNGSGWSAYSQPAPVAAMNIDGGFAANVDVFNWVFKDDFSANAAAAYRIWKRDKEANSYQLGTNAGKVKIALYIKNGGSNVPVRLSNILAALVFETPQGGLITAANFRLRDVSSANLYSLEMNANTEFGPYLIEVPNISTDLVEKAIRYGYTPQIRLLDYDMTHTTNSPYRLSVNFTGENLKVMANNARSRSAKINIIGPNVRQTYQVAAFATSTENATDACAPVATPDATSTASPGVPLTRALDRAACSMAVGGKVGGVPVIEYEQYVLDFTGVPLYDNMNPKIVYVTGIKRIGDVVNNATCDAAFTNICYIRFANYLTSPNNNFAIWTVFAKGQYFNYSQFDYINTTGSGTVRGYPSGSFNSNTRVGAIPRLKGVGSTVWAGDTYDVVYMKVSDIIAMRAQPGGSPIDSGVTVAFNTKWDNSTIGADPYAPDVASKLLGRAITGDQVELTFQLNNTRQLNYNFGNGATGTNSVSYTDFNYTLTTLSQRFDVHKALQFEVSMALGAAKSDWVSVLDTAKLAPCNRNAAGNPDVTVDFVAQRFTLCFILPKGNRTYLPPISSGDYADSTLYSIYLRPKLLDEYRNVIWPEMRTEVRRFKANLNRSYTAGAQLIEVTDVVGPIVNGSTFTIGGDSTVYTVTAYNIVSGNPKLSNIGLSAGLAFEHKAGERIKANTSPLVSSQVIVHFGNSYFSSWNTYLASLGAYLSNARCTALTKDCDFFAPYTNPATTTGAMGLTFNQSNINWVGHNLFAENVYDYNTLDASRYANFMATDFDNLLRVPGTTQASEKTFMTFVKNEILARVAPQDFPVSTEISGIFPGDDGRLANKLFVNNGRAMYLWYVVQKGSYNRNYTQIVGRIHDLQSGTIGDVFEVARVNNPFPFGGGEFFIQPNFEAIQNGSDIFVGWAEERYNGGVGHTFPKRMRKISFPTTIQSPPGMSTVLDLDDAVNYGDFVRNFYFSSSGTELFACVRYPGEMRLLAINIASLAVTSSTLVHSMAAFSSTYAGYSADGNQGVVAYRTTDQSPGFEAIVIRHFSFDGTTFNIDAAATLATDDNLFYVADFQVAFKGSKAFVTWVRQPKSTQAAPPQGVVIDYSQSTSFPILSTVFPLIPSALTESSNQSVLIQNNHAIAVFKTYSSGTPLYIGRWNMDTLQGGSILVDQANDAFNNISGSTDLSCSPAVCYLIWTKSSAFPISEIWGTSFDVVTGNLGDNILINLSTIGTRPRIAFNDIPGDAYQVVSWYSINPALQSWNMDVLGKQGIASNTTRLGLRYGLNNFFTSPLLESSYNVTARIR